MESLNFDTFYGPQAAASAFGTTTAAPEGGLDAKSKMKKALASALMSGAMNRATPSTPQGPTFRNAATMMAAQPVASFQ